MIERFTPGRVRIMNARRRFKSDGSSRSLSIPVHFYKDGEYPRYALVPRRTIDGTWAIEVYRQMNGKVHYLPLIGIPREILELSSTFGSLLLGTPNKCVAEELAAIFHKTYERMAPNYGYETRKETAIAWEDIPNDNPNKRLMIAVCGEILSSGILAK